MAAELETKKISLNDWLEKNTEFEALKNRLFDSPEEGFRAWARTTAGAVALLFGLQLLTGVLLAFQYVPSVEDAYMTIAYIEQAVAQGTWIRSLHYHSSVLLPVALLAHLGQMIARRAFQKNPAAWTFAVVFLALALAAGATGYALPWDARSLNGVNVAVSLAGNAPLTGASLQNWLQNGDRISTMTLSRFYGLHVFATPALILLAAALRLFVFGKKASQTDEKSRQWARVQLARNAFVAGAVFLGLGAFSANFPAPFAPATTEAASFLPRPGPQFLWLFEMQKYTEGTVAALLAFGIPTVIFGGLLLIPRFVKNATFTIYAVSLIFTAGLIIAGGLTGAAYFQDASDARISEQLARQEKEETEFRAKPFKPKVIQIGKAEHNPATKPESADSKSAAPVFKETAQTVAIPPAYVANCAKCHGANGEGKGVYPELHNLTTREEEKRSDEDLVGIINNPSSYGLSAKMPAYEKKLSEAEKQEIVRFLKTLN